MSNVRILVVDDEPLIVTMLTKHFEEEGFTVLIARDGYEALTKARTEAPDLILLDLILPKLNGYEVCTLLKQDTRYQHIPVVMLTAKVQEKDEQLGRACGAQAYLKKPVHIQTLLEQIRATLPMKHPARPTNP